MALVNLTFLNDSNWIDDIDFNALSKVHLAMYSLNILLGMPFNLWLLLVLLTSAELRSRLRNKILAFICVQHLVESALIFPLIVDLYRRYNSFKSLSCLEIALFYNFQLISDFVSNWNVFLLMLFYVFHVFHFQPCWTLSSKAVAVLTCSMLTLPWVISAVLTPSVMKFFHDRRQVFENTSEIMSYLKCLQPIGDSYVIYKSLDTAVPLFASTLLLVAGILLKRWGLSGSRGMASELIEQERPEVDSIVSYIAALIVTYICDFGVILAYFEVIHVYGTYENYIWWQVSEMLANVRVILFTAIIFFFKDIRVAARNWRPRRLLQSLPDLTVSYRKDSAE
ncbi:hypothetical protein Bpfe_003990 [Biomphalaria pfeifferi]|uniref:Uncharacterized protein n=1 Tax=Biomphalaria pfeifferi TaxID=112525 RepID=A0AAD8FJU6_BIOPF|nr:hypothetical protein Bpfe_003990 [Biomphalaria pfeifferi]